jgi:hypothetical protein
MPERVILICEDCGERTVLGGPLEVWLSGSTQFECGCGERLTLADQLERDPTRTEVGASGAWSSAPGWG